MEPVEAVVCVVYVHVCALSRLNLLHSTQPNGSACCGPTGCLCIRSIPPLHFPLSRLSEDATDCHWLEAPPPPPETSFPFNAPRKEVPNRPSVLGPRRAADLGSARPAVQSFTPSGSPGHEHGPYCINCHTHRRIRGYLLAACRGGGWRHWRVQRELPPTDSTTGKHGHSHAKGSHARPECLTV